jgi:molecular chaperone DnaK
METGVMYLGIDLGTSNSAIAGNNGSELKLFKTTEGTDVLPSAIYIDKRGHKFVGVRAYANGFLSPENVAQGFKRLMGTSSPISFAATALEMSAEECSAEIIRTLLGQAKTETGDFDAGGAVVTIPAAFNQMQSEATIRAANVSGLERVGLLQEPIAAAMASMAGSRNKNGQFLVYDLGGGTFDVALVQSVGGSVNVVAHEGINMLGGRDFDRMLVNEFVRPWLVENFSLPQDFQTDSRYRRLVGIARYAAERAKIALSSTETAVIFAGDEEVRVADVDGNDIYLSVDITRNDLDDLIADQLDESITICRKVLKDNGYNHEDIDRVVLIGGPSKMPCVRTRVPQELGIPADLQTDPMTAVAIGAAIFAESRDWSKGATKRKPSRASATVKGPIEIRYDFPARTSEDRAKIRIKPSAEADVRSYRLQIDTPEGWTSGFVNVRSDVSVEVPVANRGDNRFRITVYDSSGAPVAEACSEITIFRTHASAAGIPATHTLAVKVVETASGRARNELDPLVTKGTLLPAHGSKSFRAAKDLRGGQSGQIDIEFFQQVEGVPEPELNLVVGSFQLDSKADLEEGDLLRKGDEITIRWEMDDNGLLKCTVEIPQLSRVFDTRNFYTPSAGHQNFEGKDGESLAGAVLADAGRDLEAVKTTLGNKVDTEVEKLQRRVDRQREALLQSVDAETRRSVTEEARTIRQEISRLKHAPENRGDVLLRELAETQEAFDRDVREHADATSAELFDRLVVTVQQAIKNGDMSGAERALREMEGILYRELWRNPGYVLYLFKTLSSERYLSVDKALHDTLVSEGQRAVASNDLDGMRRVLAGMFENRFSVGGGDKVIAAMAGLMRR